MTWGKILPHWTLLLADLAQAYGIVLRDRLDMPWPDLRDYVFGLFGLAESRLRLALFPPRPPGPPRAM